MYLVQLVMKIPMKDLSNNVILCTWIFFGIVAYSTPNSKEYQTDYTHVSNKEEKGLYGLKYSFKRKLPEQSNNEWGSISDPSY